MLYLIDPKLTGAGSPEATEFAEAVSTALGDHQAHEIVTSEARIARMDKDLREGDGIAVFTGHPAATVDENVERLLSRARRKGASVLPVAVAPTSRRGPEAIGDLAVFAVYDWLEARDLPKASLASIARLYAWSLLATTRPTFASREIQLFVSYARKSSEELARRIDEALVAHGNLTVRDNKNFRTGGQVRSVIEEALNESDVLVLLDTPSAQGSEWVEWELSTAAKRGLPIVWVDCGAPRRSSTTNYLPGPSPDITADAEADPASLADRIDRVAREKLLATVPNAHSFIARLDDWADDNAAELVDADPRLGIYELSYQDRGSAYPTRRRRHVVQVFARRPQPADHARLVEWLASREYLSPNDRQFDAAIMASSAPTGRLEADDGYTVSESTDAYLLNIETDDTGQPSEDRERPGMLFFGAFPSGPAATEQIVTASRNATATWLRLGGEITFAGHPTIVWHVVHSGAEAVGQGLSREQLHLYQSDFWPEQTRMDEIRELADVRVVPGVPNDMAASLERMRRRMIDDSRAIAAVAVGGRTAEGGTHIPGVEEEVLMSVANAIPVFLLGATGGVTAILAERYGAADPPYAELNGASIQDNERLATTDDYSGAAVAIWKATAERDAGS